MRRICAILAAGFLWAPAGASAGDKSFDLVTLPEPAENGALRYIIPRFSLKTGVRVAVTVSDAPQAGDGLALVAGRPGGSVPVMIAQDGRAISAIAGEDPDALRFLDWLTSDVGRRTLESYVHEGSQLYSAPEPEAEEEVVHAVTGDPVLGEEVSLRACGRCHVISEKNKYGGIGSTPSFGALRSLNDWFESFSAFWTANPHPAFTQIEGLTEPFDPARPSPIAPVELTMEEVEAIVAFVTQMKPKDLGAPVVAR